MKLFTRYNRVLLIVSFSALLLIGILFYGILTYYLNRQTDEQLREELIEVQDFTHVKNIIPDPYYFDDIVIQYKKTDQVSGKKYFSDTVYYNEKKQHLETARYLRTDLYLGSEPYRLTIFLSKLEREEQIRSIFLAILFPVIFIMIIIYLINRIMIRKLWAPFNQILDRIKLFNLSHETPFEPVDTRIQEFNELNKAVTTLSEKIKSDYHEIKLFTENASHEMMTPLAIINSKLDTILQSNSLGRDESEALTDLYKATSRLAKLNQSLLLLVKIDNNQIADRQMMDVTDAIKNKLAHFQELISSRQLTINTNLEQLSIITSLYLFDFLINNLFSNAIRHNRQGGKINVTLTQKFISFSNTSDIEMLDERKIYKRFYKDPSSEGTGLGLSILKQICTRLNYQLIYSYNNGLHEFKVIFSADLL